MSTSVEGARPATPLWTASGGELTTSDGVTRFTCTEPGPVRIGLSLESGADAPAAEAGCSSADSVGVTCTLAATTSACDGLGSTCHVVDTGSGAAHECHELGHAGDAAACAEQRAGCIDTCGTALCTELAALCHDVDPGNGPLHECHELGHAADAATCFARGRECFDRCKSAHDEPVTLQFAARVAEQAFACGSSYDGVGNPGVRVEPQDFRLFVHDVRLVTGDGSEVAVALDERAPWQALGTALLDFEDASGACLAGDAATNTTVTGRVPPGDYTGVAFRVGVPYGQNHANPALQPAPLGAGAMTWGWLAGYKFLRAELGGEAGAEVLHLGAVGCTGDPASGSVSCARPNRASVTLSGFDRTSDRIAADIGALFAGADLSTASACHSSGATCEPSFDSLGVDLASGQSTGTQSVFRVEH